MYKTAMRVMMIGMVAMLGVEAEAHYMYVSGRYSIIASVVMRKLGLVFPRIAGKSNAK